MHVLTMLTCCIIIYSTFSYRIRSKINSFNRFSLLSYQIRPDDPSITNKKFIVVTGGVISGIGKGITASSIGVITKMLNLRPTAIKIDPYLNVDAGTMSPFEHGETFVLDDGAETDLDLGNYERFLNVKLTNDSNLTTGKIYQAVIDGERRGDYLGKTVQIIPHITNEIIKRILSVSILSVDELSNEKPDVCVIELGGTIGDIESMPFVEALRQLQLLVKPENFALVHVSMVPLVGEDMEQKTKPTQHSVKELRSLGLSPDFIVCRAKVPITSSAREKIALFCNVPKEHVLSVHDVSNIYMVPQLMREQNMDALLSRRLNLHTLTSLQSAINETHYVTKSIGIDRSDLIKYPWNPSFNQLWNNLVDNIRQVDSHGDEIKIALVGKYTSHSDAYLSLVSAIKHSTYSAGVKLTLHMIESSQLESTSLSDSLWDTLNACHGIIVPGGFGDRGVEGMIRVCQYAREKKVPFLGICLGMQVAVIEYTRHVLNKSNANSEEFDKNLSDLNAAIVFMPEGSREVMGGTMRLGSRITRIQSGTKAWELYHSEEISERHRHRYEVNPLLVPHLESNGLKLSGRDVTGQRMEIAELEESRHPYYVGVQFHPEFQSRPFTPAPVILGLIEAAKKFKIAMASQTSKASVDKIMSTHS